MRQKYWLFICLAFLFATIVISCGKTEPTTGPTPDTNSGITTYDTIAAAIIPTLDTINTCLQFDFSEITAVTEGKLKDIIIYYFSPGGTEPPHVIYNVDINEWVLLNEENNNPTLMATTFIHGLEEWGMTPTSYIDNQYCLKLKCIRQLFIVPDGITDYYRAYAVVQSGNN